MSLYLIPDIPLCSDSFLSSIHFIKLIGQGNFSSVFECESEGKLFALKVIDKERIKSLQVVERVIQEVEIHKNVKHTNICELYSCFQDQKNVYLKLQLCEGELLHFLAKEGSEEFGIHPAIVQSLFRDVCNAVAYLHESGIVHRDLKLSNILLIDRKAKLCDFGMASRMSENTSNFTLCGTPNYIGNFIDIMLCKSSAPEIIGRHGHSFSADIWSLGCMLYTLLVGVPPFEVFIFFVYLLI